jgi:membrane fusion protein (multidrug efflux system)
MAIIPIDYVWVDANFKETQLKYMRVGQPATVTFDMYGSDVVYKGKVLGIGMGSGSVFSIIPPQNATGNWIKIVQRLPVRISLDPKVVKDFPVRLGISASVYVDITDRKLPMLSQETVKKVVASTPVFDIDMENVDKVIKQTIRENLIKR